jgi:UDP-N-acetylglucosamine transferase subunit ALG13
MILLSVGTQFPFDRLVRAVDEWAVQTGRDDIVAQIGPSQYKPKMLKCFGLVSPDEFRDLQAKADLIIAHAGMGSILTAMELGKPIIVFPRDHTLGEHRNGHQMATADRFNDTPGIIVVRDTASLAERLNNMDDLLAAQNGPRLELHKLAQNLRSFIATA